MQTSESTLRLLILGAHPDDAEFHAGGLATIYRRAGHHVKMVSVTCGDAGHYQLSGPALAAIRRTEAANSAAIIGATAEVWDFPDGKLQSTLTVRERIIRELRLFQPDLVLTHRTNDYHPDHRAVGDAVRDACYMVTVPSIVPDVPILKKDPIVAFMADRFTKPNPIQADAIVNVTGEVETTIQMLSCHASQFFDWLPYNRGSLDQVPVGEVERHAWLREWYLSERHWLANRYKQAIAEQLGNQHKTASVVEIYEISEHGAPLSESDRKRLFPNP